MVCVWNAASCFRRHPGSDTFLWRAVAADENRNRGLFSIPCSCRATSCVHGFRAFALLFVVALFGLDAQRSVRYDFESLFRNQFARFAAYSVGLVLDTHESRFEMLYEFELSLGEPARLLFREGSSSFFQHFKGGRRIFRVVAHRVGDGRTQQFVVGFRLFELVEDDGLEFGKFLVRVSGFFDF